MRAYVIAAYGSAPVVRALHERLRAIGIEPTSSWAEDAHGPEDLEALSDAECLRIWQRNRDDMDAASIAIVLADTPMREGHAEASYALRSGMDVVWIGRPTLTARSRGVYSQGPWFVASIEDALAGLEGMVPRG